MTWCLAFLHDKDLLEEIRLQRVPHKTRIKEEDGQLRVNQNCTSNRMATAIEVGNKNVCYMYLEARRVTI